MTKDTSQVWHILKKRRDSAPGEDGELLGEGFPSYAKAEEVASLNRLADPRFHFVVIHPPE